jgi:hypothetical protein
MKFLNQTDAAAYRELTVDEHSVIIFALRAKLSAAATAAALIGRHSPSSNTDCTNPYNSKSCDPNVYTVSAFRCLAHEMHAEVTVFCAGARPAGLACRAT